jgi:hypothetical protein
MMTNSVVPIPNEAKAKASKGRRLEKAWGLGTRGTGTHQSCAAHSHALERLRGFSSGPESDPAGDDVVKRHNTSMSHRGLIKLK